MQEMLTLMDLIGRLEEHEQDGIETIEFAVVELLTILRWNNTPAGQTKNQAEKSLKNVLKYIEVLGARDGEAALRLILKAAKIYRDAELVEVWLANAYRTGTKWNS